MPATQDTVEAKEDRPPVNFGWLTKDENEEVNRAADASCRKAEQDYSLFIQQLERFLKLVKGSFK